MEISERSSVQVDYPPIDSHVSVGAVRVVDNLITEKIVNDFRVSFVGRTQYSQFVVSVQVKYRRSAGDTLLRVTPSAYAEV